MKKITLFLIAVMLSITVAAQSYTLRGVVEDTSGEPLAGATVQNKDTKVGLCADIDGNFSIVVSKGNKVEFSYVGCKAQTIDITGQNDITVVLEEDSQMLADVVVIGYGTAHKKDLTGAVTQINPDKVADKNPNSVKDILRGTPGLFVNNADISAKGDAGAMMLRGKNSLTTGSDPLIIMDGMIFYGAMSEINPNDVAQIDILKDASAAAVYGAAAANGVIIITTKKGKMGKPTINVSANLSVSSRTDKRHVYTPEGWLRWREDYYKAQTLGTNPETGEYGYYQARDGYGQLVVGPGYYDHYSNISKYGITLDQWLAYTNNGDASLDEIYALRLGMGNNEYLMDNFLNGRTYDWEADPFRHALGQDYNLSVSGASEKVNYYLSAGYLNNEGIIRGDSFRTVRVNMKVNGKITNWLEIGANASFSDRSDDSRTQDWWRTQKNAPYSRKYDDEGNLVQYPMSPTLHAGYNYDFDYPYTKHESGYQVLNTIFDAKLTLPWGITYQFNFAPRYEYYQNRMFNSAEIPDGNPKERGVDRSWSKRFDWSLNNIITWDYKFRQKHHVILTLVQEAEERKYWSDAICARNIQPSDALGFHNTQNGQQELLSVITNDTHISADALMARAFYSFDNRYLLTATIRRDGYSAFGTNNPHGYFPSVSLGWNFVNEKFWKADWMDGGKLRLSWGKNGNRNIGEFVALANLSGTQTQDYLDETGAVVTNVKLLAYDRMANPDLRWESTTSTNIGLDFSFMNSRINGSIDYYYKKTDNMIMAMPLPLFTGFSNITTNLGQVDNTGFELSINSINMDLPNFQWTTNFGLSYNKNRIKHLFGDVDENGKEKDYLASNWFIGHDINVLRDFKVTGIWQADQAAEAAKYGQRPGDPIVWNNPANDVINEDGSVEVVYDDADKVFLGTTQPPVQLSMRNQFTLWKNFDIAFSLYALLGHKSLDTMYLNNINTGGEFTGCMNMEAREFWTPENQSNTYGRWEARGPKGAQSAARVINRSFMRLDNISVGYTFPEKLINRLHIERLRLSASCNNVCHITSHDWVYGDPEVGSIGKRTFNFGLQITL